MTILANHSAIKTAGPSMTKHDRARAHSRYQWIGLFEGTFTGHTHISLENPWFPIKIFPPIHRSDSFRTPLYQQILLLILGVVLANISALTIHRLMDSFPQLMGFFSCVLSACVLLSKKWKRPWQNRVSQRENWKFNHQRLEQTHEGAVFFIVSLR